MASANLTALGWLDLEIRHLGVYDKEEWAIKAVDFTFVKAAATFQGRTTSQSLNAME